VKHFGEHKRSAGRRASSVLFATALVTVTGAAAMGADTASGSGVAGLRHAACPPSLSPVPLSAHSADAIRKARIQHLFKVGPYTRKLRRPVDWGQDPHHSQRFRNALASLTWVDPLLYQYRHRQRRGSLKQARNLMLDWVHHQSRHGADTAPAAWHSKVVGDRAGYLGYMTRAAACEQMLSKDQALDAIRSLKAHASWLLHNHAKSNHGLFDDLGLLALGRDLRFTHDARQWRRVGRHRFATFFQRRVKADEGFWLENSAAYHYLLTNLLARFVPAARGHGAGLPKLLRRMKAVGGWLIQPDNHIVQFGDSNLFAPPLRFQRSSDDDHGMLALLKSGLAVVKQPGSFLSVIAAFHNTAHKHSDELSFDLFDHGQRVVSDTGMYDKDPGRLRKFVKSARAHSTLTVDGRDFPRSRRFTYGSGLQAQGAGSGWYAVQGKNPLLSPQGVRHFRLFVYKPGTALIIVDRVRSSRKHTYRRYFQLGADIRVTPGGPEALDLHAPSFTGTLHSESSIGREKRSLRRGSTRPLAGWTSPSYRTFVPRWTVALRSAAGDADYVTTISLDSSDLRARVVHADPRRTTLSLSSEAASGGTLTIERTGSNLAVVQNP
jgi:heparinase II/III-like protein